MKQYLRNSNYILREVHGSCFLIDITDNYEGGKCKIIELNDIGAFIWNSIETPSSAKSVTDKLLAVIRDEVDSKEVFKDVEEYLNSFVQKRIASVGK